MGRQLYAMHLLILQITQIQIFKFKFDDIHMLLVQSIFTHKQNSIFDGIHLFYAIEIPLDN